MPLRRATILVFACILPFAAGCRRDAARPASQPGRSVQGSIQGSITFTGPISKPASTQIDQDPECASLRYYRTFSRQDHLLPRTTPPVFLWISTGLPSHGSPTPRRKAVLTQLQCRFHPQILGAMPGQPVDFTNTDPFPAHFRVQPTVAGNPSLTFTQPPQKIGQLHTFPHPELMIPVTSPNRPWMHAWINIVPNSHFTISGPKGHFILPHLPPGTYTLSAIRPGAPAQSHSVTIRPGAVTRVHFTFTPPIPPKPTAKK